MSENFLHHNLRRSCHNVLSLSVARSNNFGDIVKLPRTFIAAHLLAFVRQFSVGKVFVVESKSRPRSARRRYRLIQWTVMDTMVNEIRCWFVVRVQRHERRRRIDSFTGHFTPTKDNTKLERKTKTKNQNKEKRVTERITETLMSMHNFWSTDTETKKTYAIR